MKGAPGSKEWDEITGVLTEDTLSEAQSLPSDRKASYDIVIANIVSQPLISLAPTLASLSKQGGQIALSGLQTCDINAVVNAYKPFFEDIEVVSSLGEWVILNGTRNLH